MNCHILINYTFEEKATSVVINFSFINEYGVIRPLLPEAKGNDLDE